MTDASAAVRSARYDLLDPLEASRLGGLEFFAEEVVEGFLTGLHRSPRRGFSVEFSEHRGYQPGDEPRHLDWRLLARADRLYVKQYEEETNLRAVILCDVSRSMAWSSAPGSVLPKLDYGRRLAAALALVLLRQRDAVGCIAFDDAVRATVPPSARQTQWRRVFTTLSALRAGRGTAAAPALRRVTDLVRRRGLVVLISDLLLEPALVQRALRFLRHRGHQVMVLHLMDPGERRLAGASEARFEDPEDGSSVVARPRDIAARYAATVDAAIAGWRRECRRHGIGYHCLGTEVAFGTALRRILVRPGLA